MSIKVIKFEADWCGPCKSFKPTWNAAVDSYPNVEFETIDADKLPSIVAKYKVQAIPTFVVLENGKEVDRLSGANPGRFHEMINRWL